MISIDSFKDQILKEKDTKSWANSMPRKMKESILQDAASSRMQLPVLLLSTGTCESQGLLGCDNSLFLNSSAGRIFRLLSWQQNDAENPYRAEWVVISTESYCQMFWEIQGKSRRTLVEICVN